MDPGVAPLGVMIDGFPMNPKIPENDWSWRLEVPHPGSVNKMVFFDILNVFFFKKNCT